MATAYSLNSVPRNREKQGDNREKPCLPCPARRPFQRARSPFRITGKNGEKTGNGRLTGPALNPSFRAAHRDRLRDGPFDAGATCGSSVRCQLLRDARHAFRQMRSDGALGAGLGFVVPAGGLAGVETKTA